MTDITLNWGRWYELILSERITRVRPFFTLLRDPETRIWYAGTGSQPNLIQSLLEALAYRNWTSFETVEKNWYDSMKLSLQKIEPVVTEFKNYLAVKFTFNPGVRPTAFSNFRRGIGAFRERILNNRPLCMIDSPKYVCEKTANETKKQTKSEEYGTWAKHYDIACTIQAAIPTFTNFYF